MSGKSKLKSVFYACMALCLLGLGSALAETETPSNAALPDSSYVLNAGDEIAAEDAIMGKLTTERNKILADGTIDLPLIGSVPLAGLTVEDAQKLLNTRYTAYFLKPAVTLQVQHQHPIRIYVQGAVASPGVYVSGKSTGTSGEGNGELGLSSTHQHFYQFYLSDALMMAGGLKQDADIRDIRIHRTFPKPQTIHVNLWELFRTGSTVQDLPLREHDMIEVATAPKAAMMSDEDWKAMSRFNVSQNLFKVNVIGAVKQPGTYEIGSDDNILAAIAQAGGFTDLAKQKHIYLLRTNVDGQVFKKRVDASIQDAGRQQLTLLPEDVIFVDEANGTKALRFGRHVLDRATGAALFPLFNQLLNK